jgi:hypothetical protein
MLPDTNEARAENRRRGKESMKTKSGHNQLASHHGTCMASLIATKDGSFPALPKLTFVPEPSKTDGGFLRGFIRMLRAIEKMKKDEHVVISVSVSFIKYAIADPRYNELFYRTLKAMADTKRVLVVAAANNDGRKGESNTWPQRFADPKSTNFASSKVYSRYIPEILLVGGIDIDLKNYGKKAARSGYGVEGMVFAAFTQTCAGAGTQNLKLVRG